MVYVVRFDGLERCVSNGIVSVPVPRDTLLDKRLPRSRAAGESGQAAEHSRAGEITLLFIEYDALDMVLPGPS